MKVLLLLTFCFCAVVSSASQTPFDANQIDLFDRLDDYSLLEILGWMDDFGDLATVASLSPRARQLVWDLNLISRYNIKNASLFIEIRGETSAVRLMYQPDGKTYHLPLCTEHDQILNTLEVFCSVFNRLEIELNYFYPHGDFTVKFVDRVNRYCSTIPQKLSITWIQGPIHTEFTAWNVSSVEIHGPERISNFSIAAHFPRVEKLHIKIHDNFTTTDYLPHLKHLEVSDRLCGHFNFRAFAEKNPQITSAKLVLCHGLDILQEVNELLPNLVSLYYEPRKDEERIMPRRGGSIVSSVRFQNVTSYTIDLQDYFREYRYYKESYYIPHFTEFSQIQFDNLERLEYICKTAADKRGQLRLIGQYKEVKSLYLEPFRLELKDVRLLGNSLPLLEEITFFPSEVLKRHENFLRVLEESDLKIIHLLIEKELINALRTLAWPEPWTLKIEESRFGWVDLLTFTRNNTNLAQF